MLVIPDNSGCTIVANGNCCAFSGSPSAIVQQCFIKEIPLEKDATLIAPRVKEVEVLMNSGVAAIFCELFKENNINVIEVPHGTPRQVFGVKQWNV